MRLPSYPDLDLFSTEAPLQALNDELAGPVGRADHKGDFIGSDHENDVAVIRVEGLLAD